MSVTSFGCFRAFSERQVSQIWKVNFLAERVDLGHFSSSPHHVYCFRWRRNQLSKSNSQKATRKTTFHQVWRQIHGYLQEVKRREGFKRKRSNAVSTARLFESHISTTGISIFAILEEMEPRTQHLLLMECCLPQNHRRILTAPLWYRMKS